MALHTITECLLDDTRLSGTDATGKQTLDEAIGREELTPKFVKATRYAQNHVQAMFSKGDGRIMFSHNLEQIQQQHST